MSLVASEAARGLTDKPPAPSRIGYFLTLVGLLAFYVLRYAVSPDRPGNIGPGWATWSDQAYYLKAVEAWASGDLSPSGHWYFPGYAMMGAALRPLFPSQPFFLIDLFLFAAAIMLFVKICEAFRVTRMQALVIFALSTVVPWQLFDQFVIPWTTTPTMVLILTVLLAAIRYDHDQGRKWVILAGACGGAFLLFRPADLVILLPVVAFSVTRAWRSGGFRRIVTDASWFTGGFATTAAIAAAAYLAIYGPQESEYMLIARREGFDFLRLPLKWVVLVLDPHPLFPSGEALLAAYPWLLVGMIGAVQFSLIKRSFPHTLLAATVLAYLTLYLCYVGLLPSGLWRFNLIHYFKWIFAPLGLFAFLALRSLGDRSNWRSFALAAAILVVPLCLHVRLAELPATSTFTDSERGVLLVFTEPARLDAIDIPLDSGNDSTLYFAPHSLTLDETALRPISDFHAFKTQSGSRLIFMHDVSAREAAVELAPGNRIARHPDPKAFAAALGVGAPCWLVSCQ